jgi:hypothetical protein
MSRTQQTKPWSRSDPASYRRLRLRAHTLLADVPLHDVWQVTLPGGGPARTLMDVRALMDAESLRAINPVVRFLFALRGWLGRVLGWDPTERAGAAIPQDSYLHRLDGADRADSLVEPGAHDGPFRTLYVRPQEAVSEARNATVHGFLVLALEPEGTDHRLYWAVHVKPVGRITACYMALIDPFRRWLVYPAILRHVHRAWQRSFGAGSDRIPA